MEIDKLEENLKEVSVELTTLKHITDGLDKKGNQQICEWQQNVKRMAGDNDEMQAQLPTLRRSYASYNHNGRVELDETVSKELNLKVIQNLEAVQALKERAFETFLLQITEDKLKRYSHDDLVIFTSKFSNKIGFGGFSKVYLGRLSDGVQVAVKVLEQNCDIPKDVLRDIFVIEVTTVIKASHPNLIKLYGFCFDDNKKALIYEYMENGSLDKVLFKKHIEVEWRRLYEIAIGTANVLAYLHHDCDDQIIHHDIKPGNILLDSNLLPKVTDFGVAKIMNRDVTHFTMTRTRGTSCYIAPEMTMQASRVTCTCDVYSFGMTLFDILGMRINSKTQPSFPNEVWHKFDKGKLDEIINECVICEEDAESARILSLVALWCIQFTPETRPSMKDVKNVLEKNLQVEAPPNPFLASDKLFSIRQLQDDTYSTVSASTHQSLPRGNSTMHTLEEELVEMESVTAHPNQFLAPDKDERSPIKHSQEMTYSTGFPSTSQRENLLGLLQIQVHRGFDLAGSDHYVVIRMGQQMVKTRVMHKNVNPEWNEKLTFLVQDPDIPINLTVYDKNIFKRDDKMGEAEFKIQPFIEVLKLLDLDLHSYKSGTILTKVVPSRHNCLLEESFVVWKNGNIIQNICLRLRNVKCGDIELSLQWLDVPGTKGVL